MLINEELTQLGMILREKLSSVLSYNIPILQKQPQLQQNVDKIEIIYLLQMFNFYWIIRN